MENFKLQFCKGAKRDGEVSHRHTNDVFLMAIEMLALWKKLCRCLLRTASAKVLRKMHLVEKSRESFKSSAGLMKVSSWNFVLNFKTENILKRKKSN